MTFLKLKALVISPSATHPRDYGNRNRVFQTADYLKRCGYEVHFVLYPMEEDWQRTIPDSSKSMQAYWASFHVIPPSIRLHREAVGEDHLIDEWWDPALEAYLKWLFARQAFDVVFVNYTFLSKAFEFCGARTTRILDTHDKFSGRRQMLATADVEPEFFYTTTDQERIAFDRAHVVIAIKSTEAEQIQRETTREVITLPFYPDYVNPLSGSLVAPSPEGILRLGFIGADNSVNAVNMSKFIREFERLIHIYAPPLELLVAGNVCRRLHSDCINVKLIGRVPEVVDFYSQIDVVVAPLMFSTGIKIKVGEALGFGKPVLSTANGYDGFPITDPYQSLPDLKAFGKAMLQLAYDPDRVAKLKRNCNLAAELTKRRCQSALENVEAAAKRRRRRIVFVTDQPFARNDSFRNARLHQWAELSSYLLQTIVLSLTDPGLGEPDLRGLPYEWRYLTGSDVERHQKLVDIFQLLENQCSWLEIVFAGSSDLIAKIPALALPSRARLWMDLVEPGIRTVLEAAGFIIPSGDILMNGTAKHPALALRPIPLRYRNAVLDRISRLPTSERPLLVGCTPTRLDILSVRQIADVYGAHVLILLGHDEPGQHLERVMKAHGKPNILVVFGVDDVTSSFLQAAAMHCGIAFADATEFALPGQWRGLDGNLCVHREFPNLLSAILGNPAGNIQRQTEANDAGWGIYWRFVSQATSEE